MSQLDQTLREAWARKAESALIDLRNARKAPGLFKPEFVAQREADYRNAERALDAVTS